MPNLEVPDETTNGQRAAPGIERHGMLDTSVAIGSAFQRLLLRPLEPASDLIGTLEGQPIRRIWHRLSFEICHDDAKDFLGAP